MTLADVLGLLEGLDDSERRQLLRTLRERYGVPVHPLEDKWNTTAEVLLEAIDQATDLTQRGIRGILAEATFRTVVLPQRLVRWREQLVVGDQPFDVCVTDGISVVRVQVKLQRKEKGVPKLYRRTTDHYVVETQRTRSGTRDDNEASRPYRVGEFDVLAVCLHPSTNDWTSFMYCASQDLLVRESNPTLLEVMQPFPKEGSAKWSGDFDHAAERFLRRRVPDRQP